MRINLRLLGLPTSLLLLLSTYTTAAHAAQNNQSPSQAQWKLPMEAKRWPPDSPHRRRQLEAVEEHLRLGRSPVGVMKMSDDQGEKFYMEYWQFEGDLDESRLSDIDMGISLRTRDLEEEKMVARNLSAILEWRPPFMLHGNEEHSSFSSEDLRARMALQDDTDLSLMRKRDFVCPTDTSSCSGLGTNYSSYCCANTEVCFAVVDQGFGPVGCCPIGSTCGGKINACNAPNTACDDSLGGGCCIPNYVCVTGGCVINPTLVVTTTITKIFTVSGATDGKSTQTTTATSTLTSSTSSSSIASVPSSSSSGTGTATGDPGIRQTFTSTTATTSATGSALCPNGFYACSAYVGSGGCCRTGRDCKPTSCAPTSSTTIISSGLTVVVPVGPAATVNSPTGACPTGWATCSASLGGDCCLSGWSCGTASCSSPGSTTTAYMQKASPNGGVRSKGLAWMGGLCAVALCFMLGLILV